MKNENKIDALKKAVRLINSASYELNRAQTDLSVSNQLQDAIAELTTSIEEYECEEGMKTQFKILGFERIEYGPFGFNMVATVEFSDGKFVAVRQGGLGIWACVKRSQMTREEQDRFDNFLDEAMSGGGNLNDTQ